MPRRKTRVDRQYVIRSVESGWRVLSGARAFGAIRARHAQALQDAIKLAEHDVSEGMTVEVVTETDAGLRLDWFGSAPPRRKT